MDPSGDDSADLVTETGEPLHRALGLTDGERDEVEGILGRAPNHLELALFAVMWSEHCSYKSSRIHLRRLPTEAPHVLVGSGRERRGHRRRRRDRRGHPHREPQPPVGHRALPGRGHRGGRDPPGHLHHGGPSRSPSWTRCSSATRRGPPAVADRGGGGRHLRLRQLGRRAHRRRRAHLRPLLRPEPSGQRAVHGGAAHRAAGARPGVGRRATWPCCSARPPAATGSAGSACWPRPASGAGTRRRRRPSGRACRSATPTRRSASSRPASSCSTPSWWWASRTWAGPAWCAPPARRRPGAGWAWTSTSPPCPGASRGWPPTR